MGLFSRGTPSDTSAMHAALKRGTLEDLEKVYKPAMVNYDGFATGTLLGLALSNSNHAQRVAIANRLLDDGADVRCRQPLHRLLVATTTTSTSPRSTTCCSPAPTSTCCSPASLGAQCWRTCGSGVPGVVSS